MPLAVARAREVLSLAEAHCEQRGGRLTDWRREVLLALVIENRPAKAYALAKTVVLGDRPSPPAVYRALAALAKVGLVQKLATHDSFLALSPDQWTGPVAVIRCECCGAATTSGETYREAAKGLPRSDFKIERLTIEAKGRCPACKDPAT